MLTEKERVRSKYSTFTNWFKTLVWMLNLVRNWNQWSRILLLYVLNLIQHIKNLVSDNDLFLHSNDKTYGLKSYDDGVNISTVMIIPARYELHFRKLQFLFENYHFSLDLQKCRAPIQLAKKETAVYNISTYQHAHGSYTHGFVLQLRTVSHLHSSVESVHVHMHNRTA